MGSVCPQGDSGEALLRSQIAESQRAQIFGLSERKLFESGTKSVLLSPSDSEVRKAQLLPEAKAAVELFWPGFFADSVSQTLPLEEKICPEGVVVADEGLQSSDEDDDLEEDSGEDEEDEGD